MAGNAPTFGLWYDFRQRLPLGDYARFYAECLEEIEEGEAWARLPGITHEQALDSMRLFASEVAPRVREALST